LQLPNHGANPKLLARSLKSEMREGSVDFSVNVNPFPPLGEIQSAWQNLYDEILSYPDPTCSDFIQIAAQKDRVRKEQILPGNGAAELIFLIAQGYRGSKVLLVEPAFSEYRDACTANGCEVYSYKIKKENAWRLDLEEFHTHLIGMNLCFLCHPSNPTGVSYKREELEAVIDLAAIHGVTLVIDEAFLHFMEEPISAVPFLNHYSNIIILRSLTKMFHLPGARIGYAISSEERIKLLSELQPPWSVNGVAQKLGSICLQQGDTYIKQTASAISLERRRIFPVLNTLGFEVSPSSVNFYVLQSREETEDHFQLLRFLFSNGIVVRHTENFNGIDGKGLRVSVRTEKENDKLLAALKSWNRQ